MHTLDNTNTLTYCTQPSQAQTAHALTQRLLITYKTLRTLRERLRHNSSIARPHLALGFMPVKTQVRNSSRCAHNTPVAKTTMKNIHSPSAAATVGSLIPCSAAWSMAPTPLHSRLNSRCHTRLPWSPPLQQQMPHSAALVTATEQ
jgi:hypothetical protein